MKFFLCMIVLVFLSAPALFADEIHLKNKKILRGTIIQVTPVNIEYDPDGPSVYDVVPRDEVEKIVYANNKTIYLTVKKVDKIFFNNGTYVKGKIFKVTSETVLYYPEGSNQSAFVARDKIEKIIFSNGKVLNINNGQLDFSRSGQSYEIGKEKTYEKAWQPFYQTKGFHSSFIWIRATGCLSLATSTVHEETDYYKANSTVRDDISHSIYNYGMALSVLFPSIKFKQKSNFNITGLKLGIKGVYSVGSFVQVKTSEDSNDDSSSSDNDYFGNNSNNNTKTSLKQLIAYRSIGLGPDINMVLTPRSNKISMLINMFATYEWVYAGKLKSAPQLRDEGFAIDEEANFAKVSGYAVRVGIGPHLTVNTSFPVTIGLNVYYTYTRFTFNKEIPIYASDKLSVDAGGLEFSAGIHL